MMMFALFLNLLLFINTNHKNETLNCNSNFTISNNFHQVYNLKDQFENDIITHYANLLKEKFLKLVYSMYDIEKEIDDNLYDLIESIDQECFNFVLKFFFDDKNFMYDLSKKILHDGGLIQNSISTEEDCLSEDNVYLLFSGEFNRIDLREDERYKSHEALFREATNIREEACVFKECRHFYKGLFEYLIKYHYNSIQGLFSWKNFKLTGINYKNISDDEMVQKSEEEKEKENENNFYYNIIILIIIILFSFLVLCTIISCCMRVKGKKSYDTIVRNSFDDSENDNENKEKSQELLHTKTNGSIIGIIIDNFEVRKVDRIILSFDILNNLSLVKDIKEPLSNQSNIIVLSTIKLLVLFYIMLGENSFIILKYIENRMSLLSFLKSNFFFTIKIGMNSYESYKIICGVLFGYKLISFYYNHEKESKCIMYIKFVLKQIPYIIIFLIIHFLLNYPKFIFVRRFFGNMRNNYLSSIMEQYSCHKSPCQIFKMTSIMSDYNSTGFNIGQYNGCSWPILFTFSEFICFNFILILAIINICLKHYQKINDKFFVGFLFFNFIFILLAPSYSREFNDLIGGYTISRLFGLSESIAMPHVFFPLYYIGFNIGIIYYYYKNAKEQEDKPFNYCYQISRIINQYFKLFVNKIFMFILIIGIILCSLSFTFLIKSVDEYTVFFTFEDKPVSKYIFVYESVFHGIFFSFFLLFYLCSPDNNLKLVLSTEFFTFVNKISFMFFISFGSILNLFHAAGIMEVYLYPFLIYTNTLILFVITCLLSIILSCSLLFPLKWIFLYATEGFKTKKIEDIHLYEKKIS